MARTKTSLALALVVGCMAGMSGGDLRRRMSSRRSELRGGRVGRVVSGEGEKEVTIFIVRGVGQMWAGGD